MCPIIPPSKNRHDRFRESDLLRRVFEVSAIAQRSNNDARSA
jgi:hypothetical protein